MRRRRDVWRGRARAKSWRCHASAGCITNTLGQPREAGETNKWKGHLASGAGPFITLLSATFNEYLAAALTVHAAGVVQIDVFQQMHETVNHPEGYGFLNVTTPCRTAAGVCADPDTYLFWDHVHPTARGHEVLAETFEKAIKEKLVMRYRHELF